MNGIFELWYGGNLRKTVPATGRFRETIEDLIREGEWLADAAEAKGDEPEAFWVWLKMGDDQAALKGEREIVAEYTIDSKGRVSYGDIASIGEATLPRSSPISGDMSRDLATVNTHRRRLGQTPLDLTSGWTAEEIAEMAENIRKHGRTHNPAKGHEGHESLKRRLMR